MTIGTWILAGVIIVAIIGVITQGRKRKWYRLFTANNEVELVYRKMSDWWFRDRSGMMGFHKPDDTAIMLSKHWILKIEEVADVLEKETD